MRESEPWLLEDVQGLLADIPSLHHVSVRETGTDYQMGGDAVSVISSSVASPRPVDAQRVGTCLPTEQRQHGETDALFLNTTLRAGAKINLHLWASRCTYSKA